MEIMPDLLSIAGRLLFTALFLGSAVAHFTQPRRFVAQARERGIVAPQAATALSGAVLLLAGSMLGLGIYPDIGAILIVVFLMPAAFLMHPFWAIQGPDRDIEQVQFLKDLALAGAAMTMLALLAAGGSWGPSFTSTLLHL